MITRCGMSRHYRETGRMIYGTHESGQHEICGNPLPEEQWHRGPWLCDACAAWNKGRVMQRAIVPSVSDVLRTMQEYGVDQDAAVRILGGTP